MFLCLLISTYSIFYFKPWNGFNEILVHLAEIPRKSQYSVKVRGVGASLIIWYHLLAEDCSKKLLFKAGPYMEHILAWETIGNAYKCQNPIIHQTVNIFWKYQREKFANYYFRPLHQYHQEFVEKVGCSAEDQPGDMKKLIDCLETKSLNEIYAHAFMFDECNIVIPGFGGHSNNHIVLNSYLHHLRN